MKKILIITLMCVLMVVGCNKTENINTLPTGEKEKLLMLLKQKQLFQNLLLEQWDYMMVDLIMKV